ncbi:MULTISPECIES: amidohydrolase family protein [unclassified Roseitalea]|uniref:N-acetylglucosamine-6-phosphate deacetylase n=1 Tax=unclassified Roseitalea TaxID=2639107 RepID=UPI00273D564C|nr:MULTISPECIES: amidohydrolase family protein [unclassified Roseitalea]
MTDRAPITGTDALTGRGIAVTVEGETITAVEPHGDPEPGLLSAGLIDLQVNGFAGLDLNDGALTPATVRDLCARLVRLGVTGFLPTVITADQPTICNALAAIRAARDTDPVAAAMIAGVHVEGPSISPLDGPRGAHPAAHVRRPSLDEFAAWQKAAAGLVRLVTLAPEQPGALEYIAALRQRDVHCAIGHSGATPEQIDAAVRAGARLSTHLGNGAAAELPRHPNLIWSQLAADALMASFIADGHHLPPAPFKAMVRAKGLDRSILVSDSVAMAGMPPGRYEQAIGGTVDVAENGRISMAGTPYLAGAGIPLAACVPLAMDMAGLPLADVLPLATTNPGRFVGRDEGLSPGARADIIRFEMPPAGGARQLDIGEVWLAGRAVRP